MLEDIIMLPFVCRTIFVLKKEKLQQNLAAEVQPGLMINGVMMKTTIQAAILMTELVVIVPTVDGTPIAQ